MVPVPVQFGSRGGVWVGGWVPWNFSMHGEAEN